MLMTSIEETKALLKKQTESYRQHLKTQVENLTDDLEGNAKKAVFIVGAVVAVVMVVRWLTPKRTKVKIISDSQQAAGDKGVAIVDQPSDNPIIAMIKSAIVSFLLGLARERIVKFLDEFNLKSEAEVQATAQAADSQS